ncbi:hypothetical protein [Flavobacterium cerinum]|uniref:Uncharacterized protein n=1 Tax=Flavobacterium cerinum TaxID=2502784 RepID=A0A444H8N4_9FLAO|nr:hypothetical protein [Flavobacterium cerinum]RWW99547.1 hypothetical protein EPI11_11380 [Flavobacterium cerinum]
MKDLFRFLKFFLIFFAISILLEIVTLAIESSYLKKFLEANILTILLAFLAINTATLGVIASKVQEILAKYPNNTFSTTISEMCFSLKEQVLLLILSLIILICQDSKIIIFAYKDLIFNSALTAIFFYSIYVLWDTGKAVFIMTNLTNNLSNVDENSNNTYKKKDSF